MGKDRVFLGHCGMLMLQVVGDESGLLRDGYPSHSYNTSARFNTVSPERQRLQTRALASRTIGTSAPWATSTPSPTSRSSTRSSCPWAAIRGPSTRSRASTSPTLRGCLSDAATLLEGNNALCFSLPVQPPGHPRYPAGPVQQRRAGAGGAGRRALASVLSMLGCPQLESIDQSAGRVPRGSMAHCTLRGVTPFVVEITWSEKGKSIYGKTWKYKFRLLVLRSLSDVQMSLFKLSIRSSGQLRPRGSHSGSRTCQSNFSIVSSPRKAP